MFEPKRSHIETRREFERNLNLLIEGMREGRVKFVEGELNKIQLEKSFFQVRALPNQRIDFSTVNELVRLMSTMSGHQMSTRLEEENEKK